MFLCEPIPPSTEEGVTKIVQFMSLLYRRTPRPTASFINYVTFSTYMTSRCLREDERGTCTVYRTLNHGWMFAYKAHIFPRCLPPSAQYKSSETAHSPTTHAPTSSHGHVVTLRPGCGVTLPHVVSRTGATTGRTEGCTR